MTLLEAVLALVILGVSATGFLDAFQAGARSVAAADDWTRTVEVAESAMEAASLGDALQAQEALRAANVRYAHTVQVRPFSSELSEVVITVTSPRGVHFTLRRLVRNARPAGPGATP